MSGMGLTTKKEANRLLNSGYFGNTLKCVQNLKDIDFDTVWIRPDAVSKHIRLYEVPVDDVEGEVKNHELEGKCSFVEAPPNNRCIQGELSKIYGEYNLFYSRLKKPLRSALNENGVEVKGLEAKCIIQREVTDSEHLLELCNLGTVEFTEFLSPLGTLHRRLVIWEVRNY